MRDDTPTVYLLAGLPGSGKTTYAKALESEGAVRLAVDEEIRAGHATFGIDDPSGKHDPGEKDEPSEKQVDHVAGVLDEINKRLIDHVEAGRDVVLDHCLVRREDRDFYKRLVEKHGGQWCLIHFSADHAELIRRLEQRNSRSDGPAIAVPVRYRG